MPHNKAKISVFDHGFLYGDGIYETLRAYRGIIFKVESHIDRLFRSASLIGLNINKSPRAIEKAVYKTLEANRQKEAVLRITVSRGAGPTGLDPALCPVPTFVITSKTFKKYPPHYYQKGVKITIANTRRNYDKALNPQIKSLNFLNNILAKIEALEQGAIEAIMLNYRNYVAEGTTSNVFFVKDGMLFTPSVGVGILDGITRGVIIKSAGTLGIKVKEGHFKKEMLLSADEVFISNTTMEVMPVSGVDDVTTCSQAGGITKSLHKEYKKIVSAYIEEYT